MTTNITPGIILLLLGIWLLYWVGKRKFNRRGSSGLQQFSSYGWALIVLVMERIAKLLGWVLIVAGLLWLLYVREVGKRKEKATTERKTSKKYENRDI